METIKNNQDVAEALFTTLKAFNPGLKKVTFDANGDLLATMSSVRCCKKVAFDLAMSGAFKNIQMLPNRKDGGFMVQAFPKHLN